MPIFPEFNQVRAPLIQPRDLGEIIARNFAGGEQVGQALNGAPYRRAALQEQALQNQLSMAPLLRQKTLFDIIHEPGVTQEGAAPDAMSLGGGLAFSPVLRQQYEADKTAEALRLWGSKLDYKNQNTPDKLYPIFRDEHGGIIYRTTDGHTLDEAGQQVSGVNANWTPLNGIGLQAVEGPGGNIYEVPTRQQPGGPKPTATPLTITPSAPSPALAPVQSGVLPPLQEVAPEQAKPVQLRKPQEKQSDLRKEFGNDDVITNFRKTNEQMGRLNAAWEMAQKSNNFAIIDQTLITALNKLLDPPSVVRESEYARTPENLSLLNNLRGRYEALLKGGAKLTQQDRAAIVEMANAFNQVSRQKAKQVADRFQQTAVEQGYDPKDVILGDVYEALYGTAQNPGTATVKPKFRRVIPD